MTLQTFPDVEAVAAAGAAFIAAAARTAIAERGQFLLAVSGGRTPWIMLKKLADEDLPWPSIIVFQVDERIAPVGDPDRNFTLLSPNFAVPVELVPMPVEMDDSEAAARQYAKTLETFAGNPPVLDLVHLGLGPDGHTASLVPGDRALDIHDREVAITGVYQKRTRMTLTYPVLNRARQRLWVVTGAEKAGPLRQLLRQDSSIPAGRVNPANSTVYADADAAR